MVGAASLEVCTGVAITAPSLAGIFWASMFVGVGAFQASVTDLATAPSMMHCGWRLLGVDGIGACGRALAGVSSCESGAGGATVLGALAVAPSAIGLGNCLFCPPAPPWRASACGEPSASRTLVVPLAPGGCG